MAQGVKKDLVERVEDWLGIHFGKTLLEGRSLIAGLVIGSPLQLPGTWYGPAKVSWPGNVDAITHLC